ncbi:MAG: hypothetical protein ACLQGN_28635, partial [Mycobacterium sp.]|uniref:hypothetical protein n=1 Tax=Mycobacterium sp. TaxID=1785 RepID=UPI003F998E35
FAELFIKYYGRSGEFGYENLKTSGQQHPDAPFEPLKNAQALAQALAMYPPIWQKICNDKRTLHGQRLGSRNPGFSRRQDRFRRL